jgi:ABC-2 type transport system ATP-binding protein
MAYRSAALAGLPACLGGERVLVVDLATDSADASVPGAEVVAREGLRVTFRLARETASASHLIARVFERYRVADLTVQEPEIEAAVRRVYSVGDERPLP